MPITNAGVLETDLRSASRLDAALRVSLVDTASIRNVPGAIQFLGTINGALTDTLSERYWNGAGADAFAGSAGNDGVTAVTETALTTTAVATVVVARQQLMRQIGDMAWATGTAGDISPEGLAADMVGSYNRRFTDLWATAIATASTNVGTTTVDMSHDDFVDAIYTLQVADNPNDQVFAGLAPRQVSDWQESLRAEQGAIGYLPATADLMKIKGQGFQANYLGVDVFRFSHVTTAGGNREGGMWTAGAFGFRVMIPNMPMGGTNVAIRMDELMVEFDRSAATTITDIVGNAWVGLGVLEQSRLVGIVTDA